MIATRESALAMWQARSIRARLIELYPRTDVAILGMTTEGDRVLDATLSKIGGKGLFVKELESALADGRADIAVHSMKDVPMSLPPGFTLAAITERGDPRDALVSVRYRALGELPARARVGTSSLRRESQLRARYPGIEVAPLRGNVHTRLGKLDASQYDAIVLAAAGLQRLGLENRITALLAPEDSLPAAGQGALGIECRADRGDLIDMLGQLSHRPTADCVRAERAFSRALAGSCNVPLGAYAEFAGDRLRLRGYVGLPDGTRFVRDELAGTADAPEAIGAALAEKLGDQGAREILARVADAHDH